MRFFNRPTNQKTTFNQLIDYCWDATLKDAFLTGSKDEIQEQIDKFCELLCDYLRGEWQGITGAPTIKKEDVNVLL